MAFHVGQKVVCIDDRIARHDRHIRLARGAIYTVIGFDPETYLDEVGLYLAEVPLGTTPKGFQVPAGWDAKRFRPIVERKTDISIFTAMLTPKKQEIEA